MVAQVCGCCIGELAVLGILIWVAGLDCFGCFGVGCGVDFVWVL